MIRKYFLIGVTLITSLVFVFKLISLQLINSSYKLLSDNNAVVEKLIFPERGYIYDRNQKLMVSNQPVYDLMLIPENLKVFDTLELCQMIGIEKTELEVKLKQAKRFSVKLPSIIVSQVSKKDHASIQEKIWKFKEFYLQKKSIRKYQDPIAANLLGYVSEVSKNDLKKDDYYTLGELIGRQGVEEFYESPLRGVKGKKFFQKDRFNRIIGSYEDGKYDEESKGA
jgi:penicillin-binding protein 2